MTDDGAPIIVGHAQEVDVATNALLFDWSCYPVAQLMTHVPMGEAVLAIGLNPAPEDGVATNRGQHQGPVRLCLPGRYPRRADA